MTLENQALLSNYEQLTTLDNASRVWLVRNVTDSKIYVMKRVICDNPAVYYRLQSAKVQGIPLIIHIIENDNNEVIIIEEYIHGDTIESLNATSPMSQDAIIDMGIQICKILKHIHQLNPPIICRDIKPSNIMTQNGRYYITDFNIARNYEPEQTQDTHLLGTANYAAPEQYGFGQTDARSDIYSLGVTINVLATGFTPQEKLAKGELGSIISRATQIDPDNRYQKAIDMSDALEGIIVPSNKHSKPKLFRKSTIVAGILYILWAFFLINNLYYEASNGVPSTPIQDWATRIYFFLVAFMPYVYNANYFGFLDRTLKKFERGTFKYWIIRILFTLILSLILPLLLVIFFL